MQEPAFSYNYLISNLSGEFDKWYSLTLTFDESLVEMPFDDRKRQVFIRISDNIRNIGYSFHDRDRSDLEEFVTYVDRLYRVNNWIMHLKGEFRTTEGNAISLTDLINYIRNSTDFNRFKKNWHIAVDYREKSLPHLFSIIKNIQDENEYPVFYPYWQSMYKWLNKTNICSYDGLRDFYRSFQVEGGIRRYKAFGASLNLYHVQYLKYAITTNLSPALIDECRALIKDWHLKNEEFLNKIDNVMQKMDFLNVDKWRVLNETLFKSYVNTYSALADQRETQPGISMVKELETFGILGNVTEKDYASYYTIARELGIFYQDDNGEFVLGPIAQKYRDGEMTYSDYLKYYILNSEFLIAGEVVHPFEVVTEILQNESLEIDILSAKAVKLIPEEYSSDNNAKEHLARFLKRAVEANLLVYDNKEYRLAKDLAQIKEAIGKSGLSITDFELKFIGNQKTKQKNVVLEMINKEIPPTILDYKNDGRTNGDKSVIKTQFPLNQILYGPPGTGKTYNTITLALNIMGIPYTDYEDAKEKFIEEQGRRLEFVTMHPSFSYEDFIEGLKPKPDSGRGGRIVFDYKPGIFREICIRSENAMTGDSAEEPTMSLSNEDILSIAFFLAKYNGRMKTEKKANEFLHYESDYDAFQHIGELIGYNPNSIKNHRDKFDFMFPDKENYTSRRGWKPRNPDGGLDNSERWPYQDVYEKLDILPFDDVANLVKGLLQTQLNNTRTYDENTNHVIILDEINRANISKVLGEVITLLEVDKRDKFNVRLPSGSTFSVPSNLYIIGTMNTADKSIALVDIALRRRFRFVGMYPDKTILERVLKEKAWNEDEIKKRIYLMESLNSIIRQKKKSDFTLGHSYFMESIPLEDIIDQQILPLLMEYFQYNADDVKNLLEKQLRNQKNKELKLMPTGIYIDTEIFEKTGELRIKRPYMIPKGPSSGISTDEDQNPGGDESTED